MKAKRLIVGRTMTINLGNYESDRPHAEIEVELEEGDDVTSCAAELIDKVNEILLDMHGSEGK